MGETVTTSPRFLVKVNGRQCIAGLNGAGRLFAEVEQRRHPMLETPEAMKFSPPWVEVRVGGHQGNGYFEWLEDELLIGDTMTMQLLEGGPIDPPGYQQTKRHMRCRTGDTDLMCRLFDNEQRFKLSGHRIPKRISVAINSKVLGVVGNEVGIFTVDLMWHLSDHSALSKKLRKAGYNRCRGETELKVSAVDGDRSESMISKLMEIGDEITVSILDEGPVESL